MMHTGFIIYISFLVRLKFPQVIVLYLTITAVIEQLFVLVAYAGGSAVFCSDRDYTKVLVNPTGFCTAAGKFYNRRISDVLIL